MDVDALCCAAVGGHVEIVKAFLAKVADLFHKNSPGSALFHAAAAGQLEVVRIIEEKFPDRVDYNLQSRQNLRCTET